MEDSLASKSELEEIKALRSAFEEPLEEIKKAGPLPGCFFGDIALLRVLRGNAGDATRAREWFSRFLARFKDDKVGELVAELERKLTASGSDLGSVEMLPHHDEIQKYVRFMFTAPQLTKSGDVVWYLPMVDNDRWGLMAEIEWGHWVHFARCAQVLRCLELDRLSHRQKRIVRCTMLVDLADCPLDALTCREFDTRNSQDVSSFVEQISASIISQTLVVNAPQVVDLLGGLAKSFMPDRFRNKVNFAKGDGLRDETFLADVGGKDQVQKLYASRVGLLDKSTHLNKALTIDGDTSMPTAEELESVAKLREHFQEIFERRKAEGRLHECFFGDLALTRVLRGNEGSLSQSIDWMSRCLIKMEECGVDAIVAQMEPKLEASPTGFGSMDMLPHYEEVKKFYNTIYTAPQPTDQGDLLCYFAWSDFDRWGMMEELEWEKWVEFSRANIVLRCLELQRLSEQKQKMVKAIMLIDLEGCTLDSLSHKSFDHANDLAVSKFGEAIAANIFGRFIIVNPSWALSTLYSFASMFIPRRILNKMHFQKGDCLADETFAASVGGKEHLQQLLASRQDLVQLNGYAARALSSDQNDKLPNDREKGLIVKLKTRFAAEFFEREASGRLHDCFFGDIALARVLRGNDNDLEQACQWFSRFVLKAKEYNLDGLVTQVSAKLASAGTVGLSLLPYYDEVKDHFRCVFTALRHTPKGDVIWYLPLSDMNREVLAEKVDHEHLVTFFRSLFVLRCMEADRLSRAQERMVKAYVIFDVDGSGMGSTGFPSAPKWDPIYNFHINPFFQEMGAEVIGPCYMLNAPWIMVKGYNWFKSIIPEKLSRKLHMLDGDGMWDEEFVELMGGEAQLRYLFSSRVGLTEGLADDSEGSEVIAAGDAFEKRRDVRPGQEVRWKFSIQAGYVDGWFGTSDLDFSVTAFWFPDFGEAGEALAASLSSSELGEEVRKQESYTVESGEVEGSFRAERAGVILLRWSNTHSVLRRKGVQYSVTVEDGTGGPSDSS